MRDSGSRFSSARMRTVPPNSTSSQPPVRSISRAARVHVVGEHRVAHGLEQVAVALEGDRGARVQRAQVLAVRAVAGAQVVEQQVMQAEPVALRVERDEEMLESALVEQATPGVRAAGDLGDQRGFSASRIATSDRTFCRSGARSASTCSVRYSATSVVRPEKASSSVRALRLRLQPEARELQRDRPAFRALEDAVELVLRERRQQAARLVGAEAQLLRADLEQFAARAQVRARQRARGRGR